MRIGSFDPYFNSTNSAVRFTGDYEALGIGSSYEEIDDFGFMMQMNGKWFKYRAVYDGYNPGSGSYRLKVTLVLFGIYNSKPDNFYPPLSFGFATNGTGAPGSRSTTTYNP